MFGKLIVFGLFEMKKKLFKKKKVRTSSLGPASGSGTMAWAVSFLVALEPRFRRFYKMILKFFCK